MGGRKTFHYTLLCAFWILTAVNALLLKKITIINILKKREAKEKSSLTSIAEAEVWK